MPTISAIYRGDLIVDLIHERSGTKIYTEAPPDNQGKGESFSPSDLVCASLGACMMTIMGIVARRENIVLDGSSFEIDKIMSDAPRRIREIRVSFKLRGTAPLSEKQRTMLERAAHTCPVALSLANDIVQKVDFQYIT